MAKKIFHARCPCCGEKLVIEPAIRRVEPVDRSKKKKSKLLDEADDVLDREHQKRQESFDSALEEERKDKPSLDDFL